MTNLIELSGRYFLNGEQIPFEVTIRMPEQDGEDFLCRVESQELFTRCMKVYGVSRDQAIRLAMALVRDALTIRVLKEGDSTDAQLSEGE
jgi:hypothetical protein